VHYIVTDLAYMEVTREGLTLREIAPGVTTDDVQRLTEPNLRISPQLREMRI
jgi:3-oxoacid CoA-transferase subunit B